MPDPRPKPDQAARIFKAIRRIVRAVDLRSREVSRATGLTIPQIVVLQGVRDLGEVTTRALSAHADLSAATVVTILDKLEEKRLVERYRSAVDRRIVHTRLTAVGHDVLHNVPPLLQAEFRRQLEALPPARQVALADAMEALARMMGRVDAGVEKGASSS
ncbi:MarR family winged helix-turn-helix transcriptional regulator [Polymorphum gilvum]|uniref:Transcriptional regulator, BlaI/MecI/CopY family, putative n=1 Tax=Polymorphum gilvum (strain LMG 25793 / CGMCC 1.9160 / SL003B-26A1) TaxID=991905 RepID=F2J4C0_POLGS|nr:MarR family winged helix-turn-helix transcriptional regulator [Polymorphum gilvum]ADZ71062.1 Transcriptional regulator, BlaI/MecI/CopY family, putative [Polymorphum gilvum SL003B-26A1]